MKSVIAKIRSKFLPLIIKGVKKHEYRLASPKYTSLNVGDRFILVSNQDSNDFVITRINKITKFYDWESALEKHWKDDFKELYSNFDELIKECYGFYTAEEVKTYGIDVFEISLDNPKFQNAKILLDTNIIFQKESEADCSSEITLVYKSIDNLNSTKFCHSITIEELNECKDVNLKDKILTKLNSYKKINAEIIIDNYFNNIVSCFENDTNSKIDNEFIYQIYSGKVDFLITEDSDILQKAKKFYLKDRVMSPNDFLTRIEKQNPSLINYDDALSVSLIKIGLLNINDHFFDTLREDYGDVDFNKWLTKKAESEAYVFKNNEGIQGFLYLKTEEKDENYSDFNPPLTPKRRLKVGTFKINSTGIRLGERFLKIIFDNALKQEVDEIYVTMFKDKRKEVNGLRSLMEKWGFVEKGTKNNGEIYLVKDMKKYDKTKSPKFNYPLLKDNYSISFLPIVARYHTKLFPDLHLKNEDATFFDSACSYAIEKIYVTAWNNVDLEPGSLLCVYYMADYNKKYRSSVTGVCILNEVIHVSSPQELANICKNRSVFTESELKELYFDRKFTTVIKILYLKPFNHKINNYCLCNNNLLGTSCGPRLNSRLSYEEYYKLIELGERTL